jgi:hypothetical protein
VEVHRCPGQGVEPVAAGEAPRNSRTVPILSLLKAKYLVNNDQHIVQKYYFLTKKSNFVIMLL